MMGSILNWDKSISHFFISTVEEQVAMVDSEDLFSTYLQQSNLASLELRQMFMSKKPIHQKSQKKEESSPFQGGPFPKSFL